MSILARIAGSATKDEVRQLEFLLKHVATKKKLEECKGDMFALFELMLQLDLFSVDDTSYLEDKLAKIMPSKTELRNELSKIKKISGSVSLQPSVANSHSDPVIHIPAMIPRQPKVIGGFTAIPKPDNIPADLLKCIEYTTAHLGEHWIDFGRLGDLPRTQIEDLRTSNLTVSDKAYSVQLLWLKNKPSTKRRYTCKDLRSILRKIPRNDIADTLKSMCV